MTNRSHSQNVVRVFLSRLLRDSRGNTLVLMAAALIPLLGLIGGGVDMSRLYLTKTRLQHACDAGALAGRQAMGVNAWSTGSTTSSEGVALAMFDGNFQQGDYGTGVRTRAFSESGGTVTGTASADVPMSVMKAFGITNRGLKVTCSAKMEIPNTDVMFVLDTTGSMSCPAGTSGGGCTINSSSKITGLKSAVKCFYEALMKVDTPEVCGNDPTATTYNGTAQIRFGFVPYSVNVNVGALLPNSYLADLWNYQSRVPQFTPQQVFDGTYTNGSSASVVSTTYSSSGNWTSWSNWTTYTNVTSSSSCDNKVPSDDYAGSGTEGAPYGTSTTTSGGNRITTWYTDEPATRSTYQVGSYSRPNCVVQRRQRPATITRKYSRTDTPNYTTQNVFTGWAYKQVPLDVSGLKAGGSSWNSSVMLPLGSTGTNDTSVAWDGCIEERQTHIISGTTPSNDFATIPADAYDLNIDMVPSSDTATQWGPMLNGAVWARYNNNGNTTSTVTTSSNLSRNDGYYCPTAAKKLQTWASSDFVTYVNSLTPNGNTYHDIGMLWGARLISPTGIFGTENTNLTNIQRHIIFMTDGDTQTDTSDYSAYGVHWWDRRQTTYAPSDTNTDDLVNARLTALCTAIQNKNITLWVISYGGTGISATTKTRLSNCATPGHYYAATDSAALMAQFKQIAAAISALRLTN